MVYSSFRFNIKVWLLCWTLTCYLLARYLCVHPEFLVILIKNLKVMFLILYCSIFKELCAALATAYLLYHIHSSLSSTFLKFFKISFSEFWTFYQSVTVLPPFILTVLPFKSVPLVAFILTVQAVSDDLRYPLFSCPLVWVLVYYSTENTLCQAFFEIFSIFFCIFVFCYLFTANYNVYRCFAHFCTIYRFCFLFHFCLFCVYSSLLCRYSL